MSDTQRLLEAAAAGRGKLADCHYSVHGGLRKEGLVITKDHTEGLEEMDKLSDFAPLHVSCFAIVKRRMMI